jgi:hypothetical protein
MWMESNYWHGESLVTYQACRLLLAHSPTLKMDSVTSSETLVNFYHTPRLHVPDDNTLLNNLYGQWNGKIIMNDKGL